MTLTWKQAAIQFRARYAALLGAPVRAKTKTPVINVDTARAPFLPDLGSSTNHAAKIEPGIPHVEMMA